MLLLHIVMKIGVKEAVQKGEPLLVLSHRAKSRGKQLLICSRLRPKDNVFDVATIGFF